MISVLEGGYSDKALTSAAMGHVAGFFEEREGSEGWWSEESLGMVSWMVVRREEEVLRERVAVR